MSNTHSRFANVVVSGLVASIASVMGCGQVVSLDDHLTCPCAAGWTCENNVCVPGDAEAPDGGLSCSGTIDLGDQPVVGATTRTPPDVVSGYAKGPLETGTQVSFDYSLSSWPTITGSATLGWLVPAAAGETFTFNVGASIDGGTAPLPFAVYGPLREGDAGQCSGSNASGVMTGNSAAWKVAITGTYFVAPYHQLTVTDAGLAIQGYKDDLYTSAFVVVHLAQE